MVEPYMDFNSMFQATYSREPELFSTYPAAMTWDQRLRTAFEASGWTMAELSRRSGVSYDSLNKYLAGSVKQPRGATLDDLARALDLDPIYLARGVNPSGETQIPLMGYVGAGSEVEPDFEQVPPEGIDQIDVPFILPSDMIAFMVRGTSMLPVYKDGTIIIVYREQRRSLESFYGEEAAVRTTDGRRFIKTIMRGQPGVNLISWNAEAIEGAQLDWIGEIFAVLPVAAVRRALKQGGVQGQLGLKRA